MTLSDTPSLEEAFAAAETELTSEETTPEETPEESSQTPEEVQPESESEEQTPEEETPTEEEAEETFADKGDLSGKTPEEMEEIYKNWQASYTKKRQAEKKELEELRQQVANQKPNEDKPFVPTKPVDQMNPQEYAAYVAEMAKEEVRVQSDNSYIEAQEQAFYQVDSRLDENSPTFNQDLHDLVIMRLANARDAHEASGKSIKEFNFVEKAKEFIEGFDKRIVENNKSYLQRQSQIARTKTNDHAKSAPKTSGAATKRKAMDLDESLEAALNG